jgi:integrase/recombinase XerD
MKNYILTPESFLSRSERYQLMKTSKERSELDLIKGRITWPVRFMLIDLALYSGLRVSELCALNIGDIYLNGDSYIIVRQGKGEKTRTVYIDDKLSKHIQEFIRYKVTTLGQPIDPNSPLFPGRGNNHCPTITLQKSFKTAVRAAGIRHELSIHACRHTYATYLLKSTCNLKYCQKQLGHSDISMTALYTGILPEDNTKLANTISRDEEIVV